MLSEDFYSLAERRAILVNLKKNEMSVPEQQKLFNRGQINEENPFALGKS